MNIHTCVYIISKDIETNKEKEVCLPSKNTGIYKLSLM